jgi:5-methylcytosine-specific restriction endonuclease McrA
MEPRREVDRSDAGAAQGEAGGLGEGREDPLSVARTLVLDAGYQPLRIIGWRRAICMSFLDKVEVLAHYAFDIPTPSHSYPTPAVVRLLGQLRVRPQVVRFSRRNVYLRDDHRCQYCGVVFPAAELTLDHVVPRVAGGKTSWTNVVAACRPCNRRKGGRTPEQAGLTLPKPPLRPRWSPQRLLPRMPAAVPEAWLDWIFTRS